MAGECILVIERDENHRNLIVTAILKARGYLPLVAENAEQALLSVKQQQPDLILLTPQPDADGEGQSILHTLKTQGHTIPSILIIPENTPTPSADMLTLGVRGLLKKPYTIAEAVAIIESCLTETRLRLENDALSTYVLSANRALEQRLKELNAINDLGKQVSSLISVEVLLPYVMDTVLQVSGTQAGCLFLLEKDQLVCRAVRRADMKHAAATHEVQDDKIARRVVQAGEPFILTAEQIAVNGGQGHSAAYVPLKLHNHVIGVLSIVRVSPDSQALSPHETHAVSMLTDYAAIAIENSHNFEALRFTKERETAHVRGTFERFVPPSVVAEALAQAGKLDPGGKRREIAILFADIRGFTAWSENNPPEKVMEMLNQYLSLAAEVILGWEGTLDKFLGDGLMAIFNAPTPQSDYVHRATDVALALREAGRILNKRTGYDLFYSIGVNVGEAVVGYIGTERAMNYTAIGDSVNLAKRLQEYAAPDQIVISERVAEQLQGSAQVRALGEINIKGRKQNALAYELQGLKSIV